MNGSLAMTAMNWRWWLVLPVMLLLLLAIVIQFLTRGLSAAFSRMDCTIESSLSRPVSAISRFVQSATQPEDASHE